MRAGGRGKRDGPTQDPEETSFIRTTLERFCKGLVYKRNRFLSISTSFIGHKDQEGCKSLRVQ